MTARALRVRPYEPADRAFVARAAEDAQRALAAMDPMGRSSCPAGYGEARAEDLLEQVEADDGFLLVADDGEPVGMLAGIARHPRPGELADAAAERTGLVIELFVAPEHRRRGVGRALMDAAEREFVARGCAWSALDVFAPNEVARAFYRSHGWSERVVLLGKRLAAPRVVRAREHRVVAWKNGRGTTTEIAAGPEGATLAGGFDWRISSAPVVADGPFSAFPGVDRTLVLLEGAGLELASPEATVRLDAPGSVARFPGERAVHARLHAGPVRDLNVMVRRSLGAHDVAVVAVRGPVRTGPGAVVVVVAIGGAPVVAGFALGMLEAVVAPGEVTAQGEGTVVVLRVGARVTAAAGDEQFFTGR